MQVGKLCHCIRGKIDARVEGEAVVMEPNECNDTFPRVTNDVFQHTYSKNN